MVESVEVDDKELALLRTSVARSFPLWNSTVAWSSVDWTRYSKIIVAGPQRSGTTWFASSLAKELGYEHLDESSNIRLRDQRGERTVVAREHGGSSPKNVVWLMESVLSSPDNAVLQRPGWSHAIHLLPSDPSIFVAFLSRNCLDVFRSQNRIYVKSNSSDTGWTCAYGRTVEWNWYHADPVLKSHLDDEHDMICTMKQQAYARYQRDEMARRGIATAPIAYDSAATMSSYTVPEKRTNFKPKQIAVKSH